MELPDNQSGWPVQPEEYDLITSISVFRYRTIPNLVDVQISINNACAWVVEFYGSDKVQRAITWVQENFPNRKVMVNV